MAGWLPQIRLGSQRDGYIQSGCIWMTVHSVIAVLCGYVRGSRLVCPEDSLPGMYRQLRVTTLRIVFGCELLFQILFPAIVQFLNGAASEFAPEVRVVFTGPHGGIELWHYGRSKFSCDPIDEIG